MCIPHTKRVYIDCVELIVYIIPYLLLYTLIQFIYTLILYTYHIYTYVYTYLSIQKLNHYSNLGKTFLAIDSASILTGNTTTANTTGTGGMSGGGGSGIRKSLSSRESAMNNMRHSYFYSTDNYTNNNTSPRGVDDLTLTGGSFQ